MSVRFGSIAVTAKRILSVCFRETKSVLVKPQRFGKRWVLRAAVNEVQAIFSSLSTQHRQTFSDQLQSNGLLACLYVVTDQLGTLMRLGLQQQVRRVDIDPDDIWQVILNHLRVVLGNDSISHPMQIKNGCLDAR